MPRKDHTKSIESARRFLSIHPGNRDAPYALYLIALNYYEQISDVTRDQSDHPPGAGRARRAGPPLSRHAAMPPTRGSRSTWSATISPARRWRSAASTSAARQWLASVIRFRTVVDEYQTTSHAPEALMRLTESYLALGIPEEARALGRGARRQLSRHRLVSSAPTSWSSATRPPRRPPAAAARPATAELHAAEPARRMT